jgi:hypothetical protein
MTGDQTGDQSANPKGVQNSLKNNLCSGGTTTTLRAEDFVALQRTAEQMGVSFGFTGFGADRVEHIPVDRSNLAHLFATPDNQQIGEGARVQIVALVDFPHYAGKESVNCGQPPNESHDIHMNLVQTPAPPRPKPQDPDHDAKLAERNASGRRAFLRRIKSMSITHAES